MIRETFTRRFIGWFAVVVLISFGVSSVAFSGRLPTDLQFYTLIADLITATSLVLVLLFGEDFSSRFLAGQS